MATKRTGARFSSRKLTHKVPSRRKFAGKRGTCKCTQCTHCTDATSPPTNCSPRTDAYCGPNGPKATALVTWLAKALRVRLVAPRKKVARKKK